MALALGLTSLTYNITDGVTYNDIYTRDDKVNVSNFSCYRKQCPCSTDEVQIETVAHTYGEMNLAAKFRWYDDIAEVLNSQHNYGFCWRQTRNRQQFAYRFKEYNPDNGSKVYPYLKNRTVFAEAFDCLTYHEISADNKESTTFIYMSEDKTEDDTISIPHDYLGREGTTYIYRGVHIPPKADLMSCGWDPD